LRTRFEAARVLADADTTFEPGAVVVGDGRVEWVGAAGEGPAADVVVPLPEAVLTPGLVTAHSHLDLTHLRGQVPFGGSFGEWVERVRELRASPGMRAAALWGMREALSRGTTAFGDVVAPHAFAELVSVFGEGGARLKERRR
jgi:cytosine/adenosine deaminase-related metal-dependent hydrolase